MESICKSCAKSGKNTLVSTEFPLKDGYQVGQHCQECHQMYCPKCLYTLYLDGIIPGIFCWDCKNISLHSDIADEKIKKQLQEQFKRDWNFVPPNRCNNFYPFNYPIDVGCLECDSAKNNIGEKCALKKIIGCPFSDYPKVQRCPPCEFDCIDLDCHKKHKHHSHKYKHNHKKLHKFEISDCDSIIPGSRPQKFQCVRCGLTARNLW